MTPAPGRGSGGGDGRGGHRRQGGRSESPRAPRREIQVSPARRTALDVVREVRRSDAYANLLLPGRIRRDGLAPDDARLATELTYGTLRGQGYYDRVIALAARRDIADIDGDVLDVLRMTVHQLLALRTARHAAVFEGVELASRISRGAAGFANAVLRRVSEATAEEWRARVLAGAGEGDAALAAEHAHPEWIVRAFRQALQADPATPPESLADEVVALLEADNAAPAVSLVALPGAGEPPALDGEGEDLAALPYSPLGLRWRGGDPAQWPPVARGAVRVQDEGSQLAALALSRARPILAGERWLDLCAGPGGKAALLAAEAGQQRAHVVANEVVPGRADLVRRAVASVAEHVEVVVGDGRRYADPDALAADGAPGGFDRVLLDAPCTGIGALRRRPEARWRKSPRDVAELGALQEELLEAAIAALAPGGVLAYVTCSPHLVETRVAVDRAVQRHPELLPLDTGAVLQAIAEAPLPGVSAGDTQVQLWPHRHGTDGMFIALLEKARAPRR